MNYERTIRLADTDAAGVVYFANLLSMCHEAYEASLEAAGVDLKAFFRDAAVAIPIISAEVRCFRPLFCGDHLQIHLNPQQVNKTEFAIEYQIVKEETIALGKTRHVCINLTDRSRIALPSAIIIWINTVL